MKTFAPDKLSFDYATVNGPLPQKGDHILIIGSGVIGIWSALMLLRKGFKVTVSDPWGPGNSRSSSGGESRLMRKLYGANSFYTSLAQKSIPLWKELERQTENKIYYETGIYWFIKNQNDPFLYSDDQLYDFLKDEVNYISKEKMRKIIPEIELDDVSEILLEDSAGYLMARESVIAAHNLFLNEGGGSITESLLPGKQSNTSLISCMNEGGSQVKADYYVFACGPWNLEIFPQLFLNHMKVTRQEVLYFGYPNNYNHSLPCWVELDPENLFYGIPNTANRGFKIALDERGPEIDPSNENRIVSDQIVQRSKAFINKRFPFLNDPPVIESRVCQYSNTDSGNMIMMNHPELENVWILGGGNGHGFKHGPGFGQLFSEVMSGKSGIPELLQMI